MDETDGNEWCVITVTESTANCTPYFVTNSILAVLWAAILVVLVIYTSMFVRIYRLRKKLVLLFLIMLCMLLVGRIFSCVVEIFYRPANWSKEMPNTWIDGIANYWSLLWLASAIVFNLFNWLFQMEQMKGYLNTPRYGNLDARGGNSVVLTISIVVLQVRIPSSWWFRLECGPYS